MPVGFALFGRGFIFKGTSYLAGL